MRSRRIGNYVILDQLGAGGMGITGQVPFTGDSIPEIFYAQEHLPAPNPQRLCPDLPTHVAVAVLKCLEKEPDRRFQTTRELLEALQSPAPPTIALGHVSTKNPPVDEDNDEEPLEIPRTLAWRIAAAGLPIGILLGAILLMLQALDYSEGKVIHQLHLDGGTSLPEAARPEDQRGQNGGPGRGRPPKELPSLPSQGQPYPPEQASSSQVVLQNDRDLRPLPSVDLFADLRRPADLRLPDLRMLEDPRCEESFANKSTELLLEEGIEACDKRFLARAKAIYQCLLIRESHRARSLKGFCNSRRIEL